MSCCRTCIAEALQRSLDLSRDTEFCILAVLRAGRPLPVSETLLRAAFLNAAYPFESPAPAKIAKAISALKRSGVVKVKVLRNRDKLVELLQPTR